MLVAPSPSSPPPPPAAMALDSIVVSGTRLGAGNVAMPQPANTEKYATHDDNPVHRASEQPVSTFSIDVDTGSYSQRAPHAGAGRAAARRCRARRGVHQLLRLRPPRARLARNAVPRDHRTGAGAVERAAPAADDRHQGLRRAQGDAAAGEPGVPDRHLGLDAVAGQAAAGQGRAAPAGAAAARAGPRVDGGLRRRRPGWCCRRRRATGTRKSSPRSTGSKPAAAPTAATASVSPTRWRSRRSSRAASTA